jgi:hypothetical protein
MPALAFKNEPDNPPFPWCSAPVHRPSMISSARSYERFPYMHNQLRDRIFHYDGDWRRGWGFRPATASPGGRPATRRRSILVGRMTPGPSVSDSAVPAVPAAWPDRHAGAACDHPSGGTPSGRHGTDPNVDHDRLHQDQPNQQEEATLVDGTAIWQACRYAAMPPARRAGSRSR